MVSTTFSNSKNIKVNLPKAKSAEESIPKKTLSISVNERGEFFHEGALISINKIEEIFNRESKKSKNLIVEADKKTPHGKVVQIMDTAQKAGLSNIGIATKED